MSPLRLWYLQGAGWGSHGGLALSLCCTESVLGAPTYMRRAYLSYEASVVVQPAGGKHTVMQAREFITVQPLQRQQELPAPSVQM